MSNETEYKDIIDNLLGSPENTSAILSAMCIRYMDEHNYRTALKYAEIVLGLEPEDYMFVRLKFVVLYRMRKFAEAKLYLEGCKERFGDNGVYLEDCALIGLEFGEYADVEKLLDENADKLDLLSYNLLKIRQRLYSATQNEEKLVQCLSLLFVLYSDYEALYPLGVLYLMHGEAEEAAKCFVKLKKHGPDDLDPTVYYSSLYLLTVCYRTMGREQWREEMTAAAEIFNVTAYDEEKGLFWLKTLEAEARRQLGDDDAAARCAKEASQLERKYRTKK